MLEARSITKHFGGLTAVNQASLHVEPGEIVALIGPNGAGKTTCFAMLSGFLAPDEGTIHFDGADITGLKPHTICGLGMVRTFQIVKPFAHLSVRENIAVGAHAHIADRQVALESAGS